MDIAKKKSIVGFNSLCVWMSSVFNKVTGYDQITELESRVTVSESVFENTTQSLRELNTEYLVIDFVRFILFRIMNNVLWNYKWNERSWC